MTCDVQKFTTLNKNKVEIFALSKAIQHKNRQKEKSYLNRWKKELHTEKYRKYRKT